MNTSKSRTEQTGTRLGSELSHVLSHGVGPCRFTGTSGDTTVRLKYILIQGNPSYPTKKIPPPSTRPYSGLINHGFPLIRPYYTHTYIYIYINPYSWGGSFGGVAGIPLLMIIYIYIYIYQLYIYIYLSTIFFPYLLVLHKNLLDTTPPVAKR